jgi:hypothetical protein
MSTPVVVFLVRHAYCHWWIREQGKWGFLLTGLGLYTGFALRMRFVDKAMWLILAVGTFWGLYLEARNAVKAARKQAKV